MLVALSSGIEQPDPLNSIRSRKFQVNLQWSSLKAFLRNKRVQFAP